MTQIEQHILCLAARTQRSAADEQRLAQALNGQVNWTKLWQLGQVHEVLPLVAATLDTLRDRVSVPDPWPLRFQEVRFATVLENALLAEELRALLDAMKQQQIEAIPVKGVVLAELFYGDIGLRQAADIDVLVRQHDLMGARQVMHELGFAHAPDPDAGHRHHALHDPPYFRKTAGRDVCVDLHWTIWAAHLFGMPVDRLWDRAADAKLRGWPTRVLSPEDTLLHLVVHRSRTSLRLRLLCDIAELLRRQTATLDWDYVLRSAREGGAGTALYCSLQTAQELLDAPLPAGILRRVGIGAMKRPLLDAVCGGRALWRPARRGGPRYPSLVERVLLLDAGVQTGRGVGRSVGQMIKRLRAVEDQ